MTKREAQELAGNIIPHCMDCQKETERNELLFDGEQWEIWCYCPECKLETFLPVCGYNNE